MSQAPLFFRGYTGRTTYRFGGDVPFSRLLGQRLLAVEGMVVGSDTILFRTDRGEWYAMHHWQECCESVELVDVCGDPDDLLRTPILLAEEVAGESGDLDGRDEYWHQTWTYYKLATIAGSVTLRWWGRSNGCYSEAVNFCTFDPGN